MSVVNPSIFMMTYMAVHIHVYLLQTAMIPPIIKDVQYLPL